MPVEYPKFHFAAIPRTGSTWFLAACRAAGIGEGAKSKVHIPFPERGATLRVSMVRDPADWIRSYYTAIYPGKTGIPIIDALASDRSLAKFDDYVRWYLHTMPGQYGRIFDSYDADITLRIEDAPWCFIEFADTFKTLTQYQVDCVRNLTKINPSKKKSTWNKKLRKKMLESEEELCDRYEYF